MEFNTDTGNHVTMNVVIPGLMTLLSLSNFRIRTRITGQMGDCSVFLRP